MPRPESGIRPPFPAGAPRDAYGTPELAASFGPLAEACRATTS